MHVALAAGFAPGVDGYLVAAQLIPFIRILSITSCPSAPPVVPYVRVWET